jgi:hypothetical protein
MVLILLFTFNFEHLFTSPVGDTAILVGAALAVVSTAAILLARRLPRTRLAVYGGIGVIVAAAAFWPVARDYVANRYAADATFAWADGISDARFGIVGTRAAFDQYGFYGRDLSNTVEYIGRRGPRGSFDPIETCSAWRDAVNKGDYDYLVVSLTFNPADRAHSGYAPEPSWLDAAPTALPVFRTGSFAVFRLLGPLDPAGCDRIKHLFSGLPPMLR